jgi:putative peptide zinc metalloprotease protein
VTTVFFNLNPLMRFDGYYILADFLELPNLYVRGQQYLSYLARRYMLGVAITAPTWRARKRVFVKIYGVATFAWRIVICVCLLVAAESLFFGAGIFFAAIAVLMWFAVPLCRVAKYIVCGQGVEKPSLVRFATVCLLLAGVTVPLFVYVPWPGAKRAEAVVDYRDAKVLRVGAAGFVRQLNVRPGDRVRCGDVLAVLDNPALQAELGDLQLTIRQTELRARRFHAAGEIAAEQVEMETRKALEKRLAELQRQAAQLTITSPIDGRVVADELDSMLGTYLLDGGELMTIADESRKQLRVSIAQDDIERFQSRDRRPVRVRLVGSPLDAFSTELDEIEPGASSDVPHAALAAPGGGPLPVKSKLPSSGHSTDDSDHWELLTPRFLATINLDSERSLALKVGQIGTVTLRDGRESIGKHLYRAAQRWLRDRLRSNLFQ